MYIKEKIISIKHQGKLELNFNKESKYILDDIYTQVAHTLIDINSIEILYEENLDYINSLIIRVINDICRNIDTYEEYQAKKHKYIEYIDNRIKDYIYSRR